MKLGYDLGKYPITYDFLGWLVMAERFRQEEGLDHLEIYFQPGEAEGFRAKTPRDFELSHAAKVWRLRNMLVPLAWTLPSVKGVHVCAEYDDAVGTFDCEFNDGVFRDELAPLRASTAAREAVPDSRYVTITVRRSQIQPERNTNLATVEALEQWIRGKGYACVVIPDTEDFLHGGSAGRCGVAAAMSIDYRLALYQGAETNVFTTGGPMALALLSDAPYLVTKLIVPGIPTCGPEYLTRYGLDDGLSRGRRREVYWHDDSYEFVREKLEAQLGTRAI